MNLGLVLFIISVLAAVLAGYLWYISGPIDEKIQVVVPDTLVK